jgi:hypothetical protein
VYFSHEPGDIELGGRLNFLKFETDKIDTCIEFMRRLKAEHMQRNGSLEKDLCVMATGGGAYKFYDKIKEALGVDVHRGDEMECLIIGMFHPHCLTLGDEGVSFEETELSVPNRPRLLHLRDPTRGVLLQRHQPNVLHDLP